jgi:hypothetical protein
MKQSAMKKMLALISWTVLAVGCSGALDGDAKTDTTSMPADPNINKTTVDHVNENYGVLPADSTKIDSVPVGTPRNGLQPTLQGGGNASGKSNRDGN